MYLHQPLLSNSKMEFSTCIGITASAFTSLSLLPQLFKLWKTKDSKDVSFVMLSVLLTGLGLWIAYGIMRNDLIIIFANSVAFLINLLTLIATLYYKR